MSIEIVRAYLKAYSLDQNIIELAQSSATVELAAQALGIEGARIAKTLSFWVDDHAIVIVCAGDAKIDNHTYKNYFHAKAKMLKFEDVERYTNHSVGGVCPFGLPEETLIYLDESLKRFDRVYPACGSANSAIPLSIAQLENIVPYIEWINVCKEWQ